MRSPMWVSRMRVCLVALVLAAPAAYGNESFLCITDQSVGFTYDKVNKAWSRANFSTGQRYVLSRRAGTANWELKRFGDHMVLLRCDDFNSAGNLSCAGEFRMSRSALRFLRVMPHGYWSNVDPIADEKGDAPSMEIGKCSLI